MPTHAKTLRRLVVPALALAVIAAPLAASTASARPTTDAKSALATKSGAEQRALDAIAAARAFASPDASVRRAAQAKGSLTMALREVANTRTALTGADRAAAEALLKRPTDSGGDGIFLDYGPAEATPVCDGDICVHYVATSNDAPDPTDTSPANGVPDYIDITAATLGQIHDDYIAAGYREPRPDDTVGGNSQIDVYVGDIGDQGVYGYCTSDEPENDPTPSTFDRWAYCVLDDDYSEFPSNTVLENLQVTAAHEYFHATQYAYDRYEDSWILEATAAWVEDELYDSVDDNLQYLAASQLKLPYVPLDTFDSNSGFHYGTWSYFRFLTEKFRTKRGKLPVLVLNMFKKMDGAAGGPDQYSWRAVDTVLKSKNTTAAAMVGAYSVANRRANKNYDEGQANNYPSAPATTVRLKPSKRKFAGFAKLDHLTSATLKVVPVSLRQKSWKLRVKIDMAPKARGSLALVTVYNGNKAKTTKISLNGQGNGSKVFPFSNGAVDAVEVTLVNASGRFTCFQGGNYSCQGKPKDDNLREELVVEAFR